MLEYIQKVLVHFIFPMRVLDCEIKKMPWQTSGQKYAYYSKFHSSYWCYISFSLLTSNGIPSFWLNPCQTGLIRSHHRLSPPCHNPSHSSQRSPPHPFWAFRISCARLLICLVTYQCFLHGTEGKISLLLSAVNHSTPPLIHWYDHYSIRLHSNWPQLLVIPMKALWLFPHFHSLHVSLLSTAPALGRTLYT